MSINDNIQETLELPNEIKLKEFYYNCTECPSMIEIISLKERENIIKFKCLNKNNPHNIEMPIIEYINKMKKYNNKDMHNEICLIHNKKYDCYCQDCTSHLCKDCLKTRKHVNHFKISIEEIRPNQDELNIIENILKYHENRSNELIREKGEKYIELKQKLEAYKNELNQRKKIKIEEYKNSLQKELKRNNDKYILDLNDIKNKYLNEIKKRKNKHELNIEEINNKYKLLKEKENIIFKNKIDILDKSYKKIIQQYDFDNKIQNIKNINRLNEIIYNTYILNTNNYYNSINIINILANHYNNKNIKYDIFKLINPTVEKLKENLRNINNYEQIYPLLNYYIIEDKNDQQKYYNLLKYLPDFNIFVNLMIDKYSYKITREEASRIELRKEEIYNDFEFKNIFNKFILSWNKIKTYAIKYKSYSEMPSINLCERNTLNCFLNDEQTIYGGMYIASALENFISWQNKIIDELIEKFKINENLSNLVNKMNETINVNDAKENNIINFDEIINNNFSEEKIYKNTEMKNRELVFNFDSIEDILVKKILIDKKKFNSSNHMNFVTYNLEGFLADKSYILGEFINQYGRIDLNVEKKQIIYNKINAERVENSFNYKKYLEKLLSSFQLFIYYLIKNKKSNEEEINSILNNIQEKINLNNEFIQLFNDQNFKVCELESIYSFIELFCFELLLEHLYGYRLPIHEEIKENILRAFDGNLYINKIKLATACRKLMSRYLIEYSDINEENELFYYLLREELWPIEDWKNKDLIEKDLELLKHNNIKISNCYEFYKLLGENER